MARQSDHGISPGQVAAPGSTGDLQQGTFLGLLEGVTIIPWIGVQDGQVGTWGQWILGLAPKAAWIHSLLPPLWPLPSS